MMENRPEAHICERGNDLIAFLYSEVDEHEVRDFERHLQNCVECKLELGAFKQIRESVGVWRQEALGAAPARSAARSTVTGPANSAFEPRNSSAVAAIREFFDLSPLWMKGTIALASVLFCVVSILALAHLFENPKSVVVGEERRYTERELQAKIEDVLKSGLQEREPQKLPLLPSDAANSDQQVKPPRRVISRSSQSVAANPKVGRGPLTKSEREQLAADLRLTFPQDSTDLDLLGDGINQ